MAGCRNTAGTHHHHAAAAAAAVSHSAAATLPSQHDQAQRVKNNRHHHRQMEDPLRSLSYKSRVLSSAPVGLLPFLVFMTLILTISRCGVRAQPKVDKFELMHHSFDPPLSADNLLPEWTFGGAAIPTKSHVSLVPGVANRTGYFWHKTPLKTSAFQLEMHFRVEGPEDGLSDGFALWYSYDNFVGAFPTAPEERAKWDLFGYKQNFNGAAVFFSFFDRENAPRSSISLGRGDGTQPTSIVTGVPTNDGIYFQPLRNTGEPLIFQLTATPSGAVSGRIKTAASPTWVECFKDVKADLKAGGFLGFSATTPSGAPGSHKTYDRVIIESLHVYNLDVALPGEDMPNDDGASAISIADADSLLKDQSDGPVDVAKQINTLSRLIYKMVSEQYPMEKLMHKQLASQTSTLEKLSNDIRELQVAVAGMNGSKPPTDAVVSQVTNELQGLRNLFHSHSKHQESLQQSLSTIQNAMGGAGSEELNKIVEQSAALEATIKQQAQHSSWMILSVIIMIAVFALFVWKRMRDMEKKHFL